MVVKVTGTKPRELESPTHIALAVRGTGFWNAVSSAYGEFVASMAKYVINIDIDYCYGHCESKAVSVDGHPLPYT